jgi:hypothetical protein
MPRFRTVTWTYFCDQTSSVGLRCCQTELEVMKGQSCNTGRGIEVHSQADADAVARQDGWTVGTNVLCPIHTGGPA